MSVAFTWGAFFLLFAVPRFITAVRTDAMQVWSIFEAAVLFLWIGKYESLAGGVATLIAAAIGATALWQDGERKDRAKAASLKARLLLDLGEAVEYAEQSVEVARKLISQLPLVPGVRVRVLHYSAIVPDLPHLPTRTVERLTDLSSVLPRGDADRVSDVLHILQVQFARLSSLENDVPNPSCIVTTDTLVGRLAEALYLHAVFSELFPWARRRTASLAKPIGLDQLAVSSSLLGFSGRLEADAFEFIKKVITSGDPLKF